MRLLAALLLTLGLCLTGAVGALAEADVQPLPDPVTPTIPEQWWGYRSAEVQQHHAAQWPTVNTQIVLPTPGTLSYQSELQEREAYVEYTFDADDHLESIQVTLIVDALERELLQADVYTHLEYLRDLLPEMDTTAGNTIPDWSWNTLVQADYYMGYTGPVAAGVHANDTNDSFAFWFAFYPLQQPEAGNALPAEDALAGTPAPASKAPAVQDDRVQVIESGQAYDFEDAQWEFPGANTAFVGKSAKAADDLVAKTYPDWLPTEAETADWLRYDKAGAGSLMLHLNAGKVDMVFQSFTLAPGRGDALIDAAYSKIGAEPKGLPNADPAQSPLGPAYRNVWALRWDTKKHTTYLWVGSPAGSDKLDCSLTTVRAS